MFRVCTCSTPEKAKTEQTLGMTKLAAWSQHKCYQKERKTIHKNEGAELKPDRESRENPLDKVRTAWCDCWPQGPMRMKAPQVFHPGPLLTGWWISLKPFILSPYWQKQIWCRSEFFAARNSWQQRTQTRTTYQERRRCFMAAFHVSAHDARCFVVTSLCSLCNWQLGVIRHSGAYENSFPLI